MPLSRLIGFGKFCFNSLLQFMPIARILSSQAISFQILYTLFPRFPLSVLLPFPSYFSFHNLTYLGTDVSTHDMTIPPQTALDYILNLHNNTHPITKSHPTHPDLTTHHPTQPCLIRNSKFPRFTTVQQSWSNTALTNLFPIASKINPASRPTPLSSFNLSTRYQFLNSLP